MGKKIILMMVSAVLLAGVCIVLGSCGEKMKYEGLNLEDYITAGEYKGLSVDGYEIKVSNAEVQARVSDALEKATENKKLDKKTALKKGDTANIDYEGKIDGKIIEDGTMEDFDLELGSNSFIEGFEDGLIGHHIGDTVKLELTFPENYKGKKVAGKDVIFTVKINSATRPQTPKYTEDFVTANTEYKNKKEYEAALEKEIYKEKEETAIKEQKTSLWSDVLAETKVKKYPEEELAAYEEIFDAQVDKMAEQYGVDRSEILSQYYGTKDESKFKSIIEDSAKTLIKQEMLVEYIADKEELSYTDDEKEKLIADIEKQGYDEESVQTYTGRTMDQYAHIELLYEKVLNFILDNAKVKE